MNSDDVTFKPSFKNKLSSLPKNRWHNKGMENEIIFILGENLDFILFADPSSNKL
jgi:hypothetical protein